MLFALLKFENALNARLNLKNKHDMDRIVPFQPALPRFADTYVLDRVLAVPPLKERVAIVRFRSIASAGADVVVVRFVPTGRAYQYELEMEQEVERMRALLGLETIIAFRGFFMCPDPFVTYPELKQLKVDDYSDDLYFGVMMEHVPLKYTDLDSELIDEEAIVGFLVDILYTLWLARRDFQFYHGDLHVGNIMFRPYERNYGMREYVVGGHQFTVVSSYLPVMIDFEKSMFGASRKKEGFSDVRNLVTTAREWFKHFGIEEPAGFNDLFGRTRYMADDRFRHENIAELLTTHEVFEMLRDEREGDKEPVPKKAKECIQCTQRIVKLQCSACGAEFCSDGCARKAWDAANAKRLQSCHLKNAY